MPLLTHRNEVMVLLGMMRQNQAVVGLTLHTYNDLNVKIKKIQILAIFSLIKHSILGPSEYIFKYYVISHQIKLYVSAIRVTN